MEVHISNIPQQSTQNHLIKFLKLHLVRLSIQDVACQKFPGRNHASLTFLAVADAEKFLLHFGEAQGKENRRHQRTNSTSINLRYLGQPIYCKKSYRPADAILLRSLQKEQKDRKERAVALQNQPSPKDALIFPVMFNSVSISCGVWNYIRTNLVFEPQWTLAINGTVKFLERSMILKLSSGTRIDFWYNGVLSIATEEGPTPALMISMQEPPRFYRQIDDPIADLMAKLGLQPSQSGSRKNGPSRQRIPFVDETHKNIAGSCLIYRIGLRNEITVGARNINVIGDRMLSLRKSHSAHMPTMLYYRTDVLQPRHTFSEGYRALLSILGGTDAPLPFVVAFQVQKLAQDNYLPPETVLGLLPEIKEVISRTSLEVCVLAVRKLFQQIDFIGPESDPAEFHLAAVLEQLRKNELQCKRETTALKEEGIKRSENIAIIHRAKVTPTGIRLYGPEAEANNRVLRKYPEHHEYFLRVQFCDEDGQPVRFNPRVSNDPIFHGRFKDVLRNGIKIAGREFGFLGFSHSSLRAQSCWFMAPFFHNGSLLWDRIIIQDLGDFTLIQSPAKCAARIGQVFSDTRTAVPIDPEVALITTDVEFESRVFSDGVGTMSLSLMKKIWSKLPKKNGVKPNLFQIRYQGAKGMISFDSRLAGECLVLRPSMIKFSGSEWPDIEICEAAYKPLPMYLNRQFIKILEDMGVDDEFFLNLQAKEVQRLRDITDSPINASSFLKRQSIGEAIHLPWLVNKLATLNLDFRSDGFLRDVLEMAFLVELRLLKHKTRIPVEKGWHLHGLMDETGFLREGEIYCSVAVDGVTKVIVKNNLIISRAPALHPGDVQLVNGVMPPAGSPLLHLTNCICFSRFGSRDLPSQLSGGDLDGDRYYVMWDENAVPKRRFNPADYPRVDPIDIGRAVERDDMTDFFIKFMETDQLGRIAVLHRILADQRPEGTLNIDCIALAEMHSTAVDFSKTGIPVDMTKLPRYSNHRPDFEAPGPHVHIEKKEGIVFESPDLRDSDDLGDEDDDFTTYKYYESDKVLGKLYRAIDERAIFQQVKQRAQNQGFTSRSTIIDAVWAIVQRDCPLFEWKHHLEWARDIRDMYEESLLKIMKDYSEHPLRPLTELEAFIGNILGKTGAQSKHQRELSITMKERFEEDAWFIVNCIVKDGTERSDESLERSMACLAASLEDRHVYKRQDQLQSFKYVAAAVCLREVERLPGYY